MNLKKTSFLLALIASGSLIINTSCSNDKAENTAEVPKTDTVVEEIVELDVWVIDEHQINDLPLSFTVSPPAQNKKETAADPSKNKDLTEQTPVADKIDSLPELHDALSDKGYEMDDTITVDEYVIPLEEKQTVTAYNKKGQEISTLQVITVPGSNEIQQIVFTDKKHKDVYNVQAGMSGKDVKKLRKEMKRMEKNGQVFLYDDQSNIMYLMDAKDQHGNEETIADIETMEVKAIIWKDKKHHKNTDPLNMKKNKAKAA